MVRGVGVAAEAIARVVEVDLVVVDQWFGADDELAVPRPPEAGAEKLKELRCPMPVDAVAAVEQLGEVS